MRTVFRLDSSIRAEGSNTRALATILESALVADLDDTAVVRRDVGLAPLPSTAWAPSAFAAYIPVESRTSTQKEAAALASELADELERADAYVFAIPLYNWGVSQHVKTWIDILMTEPRFGPRAHTVAGRPACLVVARGGAYGPGTPKAGWDHATAWLTRIFGDVWGLDVQLVECELTLAPERPAMADLRDLAALSLESARKAAGEIGRDLAEKLRVNPGV